jgi:hypothetical protein
VLVAERDRKCRFSGHPASPLSSHGRRPPQLPRNPGLKASANDSDGRPHKQPMRILAGSALVPSSSIHIGSLQGVPRCRSQRQSMSWRCPFLQAPTKRTGVTSTFLPSSRWYLIRPPPASRSLQGTRRRRREPAAWSGTPSQVNQVGNIRTEMLAGSASCRVSCAMGGVRR